MIPENTLVPAERLGDTLMVHKNGTINFRGVTYQITSTRAGELIHLVWDETGITFADHDGEVLLQHPWPPNGTTYVGNNLPRGRPRKSRPQDDQLPMS